MALFEVRGPSEIDTALADRGRTAALGFFGRFSDKSMKMEPHFREFARRHPVVAALAIDGKEVPGINRRFGVSGVPPVVFVRGDKVLKKVEGVQPEDMYERAWQGQGAASTGSRSEEARPRHRVTVYSTPTCGWCTRLKSYLRKRGVSFRDVDVSRDMRAAQALVARSGQTGVPQTDIDGTLVVGFDKARIDRLLGLPSEAVGQA